MAIWPFFDVVSILTVSHMPTRIMCLYTNTTPFDSSSLTRFKLPHCTCHRIVCHMGIVIHRRLDTGVAKQLLQNLRLHPAFNRACRIGMAERVHTKPLDSGLIAKFI